MAKRLTVTDFLNTTGIIIDVRTPDEYSRGHIVGAVNLPLFSNEERAEVGTLYVRKSREAAIDRGLEIVGPRMADIVRRARELSAGGEILLYCWRGGMRSGSVQWLLETAGMRTAQLIGGYKAYRADFDRLLQQNWHFRVISGPTGSGKTDILKSLEQKGEQILDLEGLAHHRGSVFGALGQQQQPTTETFINSIHEVLRKADPSKTLWVEGESITIGHVFIPSALFKMLQNAPMISIEIPRDVRLQRIVNDYGCFTREELAEGFERIQKRLGYDNYQLAIKALQEGDIARAADLALVYYDKGYKNSTDKRDPQSITAIISNTGDPEINAQKIISLCK